MPLHFWVFVGCVIGNFGIAIFRKRNGRYSDAVEATILQGFTILAVWLAEQIPQQ